LRGRRRGRTRVNGRVVNGSPCSAEGLGAVAAQRAAVRLISLLAELWAVEEVERAARLRRRFCRAARPVRLRAGRAARGLGSR
jgi:hypothetical protein